MSQVNYERALFDHSVVRMIDCAQWAAQKTVAEAVAAGKEDLYCGFAYINIIKGQRKLLESLKRVSSRHETFWAKRYVRVFTADTIELGQAEDYRACWTFPVTGYASQTQSMTIKEVYADTFAMILRKWDLPGGVKVKCTATSRAD